MEAILKVYKRDGNMQDYSKDKITNAIFKAVLACGGQDKSRAQQLAREVEEYLLNTLATSTPTVEDIQNAVSYLHQKGV